MTVPSDPDTANPSWPAPSRIGLVQHRVATALGVDESQRTETVVAMLANNARRVPGYWIQLFLAMGIATLGLVLDSTAVVIGAMLVSPLMGPIVELGMGFAVGSSLLVLRAAMRVLLSVVLVVSGAALLVVALPFHEITTEIATRVAPTALDLMVAMFCALTAAYTTVRPGSDTTAAAAGTAIGIALVPPLCTIGFGIGTGDGTVAAGAALLFTANLSAILLLAVLAFLLLGFNRVDAAGLERAFLAPDGTIANRWANGAHRRLSGLFGSRYGVAMRVIIPGVFLVAVFVPLRRALHEVTWEVRAREAVRRIVQEESPGAIVNSLQAVRHTLSLRLLVVGTTAGTGAVSRRIGARVAQATGVRPEIATVVVPDAQHLLAVVASERRSRAAGDELPSAASVQSRVADALAAEWPAAAGPLLRWDATVSSADSTSIVVHHLGIPLGAVGTALLTRAVSARLQTPVRIVDAALPADTVVAARGRERQWLDSARVLLDAAARLDGVTACVLGPTNQRRRTTARDRTIASSLARTTAATANRVTMMDGDTWTIRLTAGRCTPDLGPTQPDVR
jgi:uncharacterized hydrophobic protein (TIGR00271 family)